MSSTPSALALARRAEQLDATSRCLITEFPDSGFFWLAPHVGTNAGWFILGIILIQTYGYYTGPKNNTPLFKLLAVFIAIAETASDTFVSYYGMVLGWGDPLALLKPTNIEKAASDQNNILPIFDILPAIFVQWFFTWRIWTFSKAVYGRRTKWLIFMACLFIILTSTCSTISTLLLLADTFRGSVSEIYPEVLEELTLLWTVGTTAADIMITVCMMAILVHAKASLCFGDTHDKISRLLRLTIQTGFLTSLIAICSTILSTGLFQSAQTVYTLPLYFLGRCYTFTLLANLNVSSARDDPATVPATQLSAISFAPAANRNDEGNPTNMSGGRVISLIRSFAHTIHNDLTSDPQ